MNTEFYILHLLLQQNVRDSLDNNNYTILSKHSNCSKCRIALTRVIYKKDRRIFKKDFNDNVMYYIKTRLDNQSSDINNSNINVKDNDPNCFTVKNSKRMTSSKS